MKNAIRTFFIDLKNYAVGTSKGLFTGLIDLKEKWNYPIYFEILTLPFYWFGFCSNIYLYFLIFVNLLAMTYQDMKYEKVYSAYSFMILIYAVFANPYFTVSRVIGVLFFPLMFYIIKKTVGEVSGEADVELIAVLGALLGIGNLMCVMLIASVYALAYIAVFKKIEIPFVPFITLGVIQTTMIIIVSM